MQELLTLIATWLVLNFGLPATDERPSVEFVPPAKMAEIRHARLESTSGGSVVGERSTPPASQEFYAIYDDRNRTIHLPERWAADSPADVSMLVHEMVHHLQNVAGLEYTCLEARERPAYQAQASWLNIFGRTLSGEFAVDDMTIHLRTHCMH